MPTIRLSGLTPKPLPTITPKADAARKIFAKFDESADVWATAIRCAATLDALCALSQVGYIGLFEIRKLKIKSK